MSWLEGRVGVGFRVVAAGREPSLVLAGFHTWRLLGALKMTVAQQERDKEMASSRPNAATDDTETNSPGSAVDVDRSSGIQVDQTGAISAALLFFSSSFVGGRACPSRYDAT